MIELVRMLRCCFWRRGGGVGRDSAFLACLSNVLMNYYNEVNKEPFIDLIKPAPLYEIQN